MSERKLFVAYDPDNQEAATLAAEFAERIKSFGGEVLYHSAIQDGPLVPSMDAPVEIVDEPQTAPSDTEPLPQEPKIIISKEDFHNFALNYTSRGHVTQTWRRMITALRDTAVNPGDEELHWNTSWEFNLDSLVQVMRQFESGKFDYFRSKFATEKRWRLYMGLINQHMPNNPSGQFLEWDNTIHPKLSSSSAESCGFAVQRLAARYQSAASLAHTFGKLGLL